MNNKKLIKYSLALSLMFSGVTGITGCDFNKDKTETTTQKDVYHLYTQYMYAKEISH